jgi:glutamate synthase (NADPH/NADH) small chain
VTFAELRERHDAVLLAMGVYQARALSVPGGGPGDTVPALDFLIHQNRRDLGEVRTTTPGTMRRAAGSS